MKSSTPENSFVQPLLQYTEPCSFTPHIKLQVATENNCQAAGIVVLPSLYHALRIPRRLEANTQF